MRQAEDTRRAKFKYQALRTFASGILLLLSASLAACGSDTDADGKSMADLICKMNDIQNKIAST